MKKILLITALFFVSIEMFSQNDSLSSKKVQMVADKMPLYPGGEAALKKYVASKIKYPEAETTSGKEGIVYISFTVTKDGKAQNVKVLKSIGESFDYEAMRVIEGMPDWIPGERDGIKVDVEFVLPISFSLTVKDDKEKKE